MTRIREEGHENSIIESIVSEQFTRGNKLEEGTVNNILSSIYSWFRLVKTGEWDVRVRPLKNSLKHYEEDVRKRYAPKTADLIMEKSDIVAIKDFDRIIDEMRERADQLTQDGVLVAEPLLERIRQLIK